MSALFHWQGKSPKTISLLCVREDDDRNEDYEENAPTTRKKFDNGCISIYLFDLLVVCIISRTTENIEQTAKTVLVSMRSPLSNILLT
jgi:hypothetical protein